MCENFVRVSGGDKKSFRSENVYVICNSCSRPLTHEPNLSSLLIPQASVHHLFSSMIKHYFFAVVA